MNQTRNAFDPVIDSKSQNRPNGYKLYKISGIGIAICLGSPIAGGFLMSQNYKKLGKRSEARKALLYITIAWVLFPIAAALITEELNISASSILVPLAIGTFLYAKQNQLEDIEAHAMRGGKFASNWKALGISLLFSTAILTVVLSAIISLKQVGSTHFM